MSVTAAQAAEALRNAAVEETLDCGTPGRTLIHSFSHAGPLALGADVELESALETVEQADEIAWVVHPLGHDLAVTDGDRVVYFAVSRPQEPPTATMTAEQALLRHEYGQGVAHGMRTTLRLLLGRDTDGAPAFPGPLTPECERWALVALDRVEKDLSA